MPLHHLPLQVRLARETPGYVDACHGTSSHVPLLLPRLVCFLLRRHTQTVMPGVLTFTYKVDAEKGFDGLIFILDGVERMSLVSLQPVWTTVHINISQGRRARPCMCDEAQRHVTGVLVVGGRLGKWK